MPTAMIVQFRNGQPELSTSLTIYSEMIADQGFPATHRQLLQELKSWLIDRSTRSSGTREAILSFLDTEAQFLMDAGVAGVASEHLAFLYMVVGEVFDDVEADVRQVMHHEAQLVEQTHEDAIFQHMRDTGCDRLEGTQYMTGAALERLQERHERLIHLLQLLMREARQD